jgi:hypothetical protein
MGIVVVPIIMAIVVSIIMAAVFPANILAVNPMVPARHVARDPDHFIVIVPIALAMVVEWSVANLDLDAIRSNGGRNKNARRNNDSEQKFVFNHCTTDSGAHPSKHGFISKESGKAGEN